mmetsp:Transcript_6217/g.10708  ORF Transcript_6217/g.10708 Transcript_6217/m.10708 type:complete len:618 (-) Transcript_6217:711-2564(-)|eukprot:CAMPEP_0196657824 /NCGR_PEP_ID=MMETSP1086-20130531/25894_1 /TAXON_ID=77921 /ORGANISM="Cyanoptyche  gloeocystis , Strain SAG4.97" /LENGTH=617 /DNA_ID=CAMNT_0041991121 /DNA_START=192 /DNA_END=2045 /DNA_ORIENTATION=+
MPKRFREADDLVVNRSGGESETSDGHILEKSSSSSPSKRRAPMKKASTASTPYMQAWIGLLGEITSHPTFISGRMRLLAPYRKVREVPKAHLLRVAHQLRIDLDPYNAFVHPARKGGRKTTSARNTLEVQISNSPTDRASPSLCPQSPDTPKEEAGSSPPPDLKYDSPLSDGNGKGSPTSEWDISSECTNDSTVSETADPPFELPDPATIERHHLTEQQKLELHRLIDGLADPPTKAWNSLLFHIICHTSFSSNRSAFMHPYKSLREMPKTQLLKIASDLKIDMTPYEAFVYPRTQDNLTVAVLTRKKLLNPYLAAWYSLVYAISSNERYMSNRDAFLAPYNKIREVPKAHLVRIASALRIELSPYEAYVHPSTARSRKRPCKPSRAEDPYSSDHPGPGSNSDSDPGGRPRRGSRPRRASLADSNTWEAPRKQPCNARQTPYMKAWLGLLAEINAHADFLASKTRYLSPYTKIREVPKAHLLRIAALLGIDLVPFDEYVNPKHAGRPRRELHPGYTLEAEEVEHRSPLELPVPTKKRREVWSGDFLRKALVAEIATNPRFIANGEKLLGSARQIGELSVSELVNIARDLCLDLQRIKEYGPSLFEYADALNFGETTE